MKIKRAVLAPLVISGLALASGGWLLQRGVNREGNVYTQARLFEEVLHRISDQYVDAKDPSDLYKMAIDGLIYELGDPHTAFMTPDDYEKLRVQTQGEYGGIGSEISKRDGWITIVSPLPDSPSERAGIKGGDKIVEIEGESTRNMSTDDAVSKLRGPKGSPVNFKIGRVGVDELIPFRLVREEIHVTAVRTAYLMDGGIGYVELSVFSENTTSELRQAIDGLKKQDPGLKGLILDLRGNPGGLLDQAISSSDLFLKKGQPVLESRGRAAGQTQKFYASTGDQYAGLPIVVLTNPGSASASEILAGALQDHDRALVVGQVSFGKGSVQTLFPLPAGHFLKMTTAKWYTPVGRTIQRPHGAQELLGEEGESGAEQAGQPSAGKEQYRTDSGRIVYGGGGITPDLAIDPEKFTEQELEFVKALQKYGSKYRDQVYNFTMEYSRRNPQLKPDFKVTAEMLDGFYQTLQKNGVEVARPVFDGAKRWISQDLAFELSYARWGKLEARKRVNLDDPQVRVPLQLLKEAHTQQALFEVAQKYAQTHANDATKTAGTDQR